MDVQRSTHRLPIFLMFYRVPIFMNQFSQHFAGCDKFALAIYLINSIHWTRARPYEARSISLFVKLCT